MKLSDYYYQKEKKYIPRTPNSAIRGVKRGIVSKEEFIALSLFLKSPFKLSNDILSDEEEDRRVRDLEIILAKKNLDLETEVLLLYTLDRMVHSNNSDIALFAAESITLIDHRYNKKIYELSELVREKGLFKDIRELVYLQYNYSYINRGKSDIQLFYLEEALNYFSLFDSNCSYDIELYILKIRILNELKRFDESRAVIDKIDDSITPQWIRIYIMVETEYAARNFNKIARLVEQVELDNLPDEFRQRLEIWLR